MLPLSVKLPETFFPPGHDHLEEADRPRFRLKVPTRLDRIRFRQAMTASGFAFPSSGRLLFLLRELVEQLPDGPHRDEQAALISRAEGLAAGTDGAGDALDEAEQRAFAVLETLALQHYPPYAEVLAQRNAYLEAMPLVLFRLFCTGWSGYPVDYRRSPEGVDEDAMAALPDADIAAAARRLTAMLRPGEADAKNSAGPSPSPSGAQSSTARKRRPTAAKGGK